jgi:uncharacterized protein YdbL (DUF1318 family)/uncharacterized membrane protein
MAATASAKEPAKMTRWITTAIGTAALALAACVTINVYFPAAAAEKAADRIIEDVWGKDVKGNEQSALPPGNGSMLLAAVRSAVEFVIPAANAQADLDVSTPAIRAVTASMETRHGQLEKYYTSGAVGLTADGLVEIRDANAVPLAERNVVRKLVADENADRNSLYREIASGNGHPEWETDIRSTFASRWIAKARGGWWYRNAAGNWVQK